MPLADHVVAPLLGGTTEGGGATGGSGGTGGVTGVLLSAAVHSAIAEASFATMFDRCSSLSVVCCSV
jgi:hypothetical protein